MTWPEHPSLTKCRRCLSTTSMAWYVVPLCVPDLCDPLTDSGHFPQMPSPDFEFPPQYPPGMSSESRHKAEQEKAVDALHEFFESASTRSCSLSLLQQPH